MRCFGVYKKASVGWMDKPDPIYGLRDAIAKPIAISPCSSDVHCKMITHKFYGLEPIEEAFNLMFNKPKHLIKPLVLFK